jgi:hypothetical protein
MERPDECTLAEKEEEDRIAKTLDLLKVTAISTDIDEDSIIEHFDANYKEIRAAAVASLPIGLPAFSLSQSDAKSDGKFGAEANEADLARKNPSGKEFQCFEIGGLLVTPNKVYCTGPHLDESNRMLRTYSDLSSSFVRVTFCDEDLNIVREGGKDSAMMIYQRFSYFLNQGVHFMGRRYKFVMYGSAQLRNGSYWAVDDRVEISAAMIRSAMGTINETIPSKYGARLSQCLSSTKPSIMLKHGDEASDLDDIHRNGYQFTDGCGMISPEAALEVARCLGMEGPAPSAFQIRYGGYKGTLVQHAHSSEFKVVFRNSMKKFESPSEILEICRVSRALPCYLNRQVITLLEALGVNDTVFSDLQYDFIRSLEFRDRAATARSLRRGLRGDGRWLRSISDFLDSGLSLKEPFMQQCLEVVRRYQLLQLKNKTQILIPKAVLLIGVCDHTQTLKEGECVCIMNFVILIYVCYLSLYACMCCVKVNVWWCWQTTRPPRRPFGKTRSSASSTRTAQSYAYSRGKSLSPVTPVCIPETSACSRPFDLRSRWRIYATSLFSQCKESALKLTK